MLSLLFLLTLLSFVHSKNLHITLLEKITHPCPGARNSELIDERSVQMGFEPIGRPQTGEREDTVSVTMQNGETRSISFPGCYRINLSFRVKEPIKNPYVEAFLQLGTNIPCQSHAGGSSAVITDICTNITQSNWCPQTANERARRMLSGKSTCQFCNLCGALDDKTVIGEASKYLHNEGSATCDTLADRQSVQFTICTPTRRELQEKNAVDEGKLEEYWSYLKQGVFTAVMHLLSRDPMEESKRAQCRTLCATYNNKRSVSSSYKATLLKSIENVCSPKDDYVTCILHTLKFDMNGDFS